MPNMESLQQLLAPERLFYSEEKLNEKRVLEILSKSFTGIANSNSRDLLANFIEREKLGSTALGKGLAIPHIRYKGVDKPYAALMLLAHGIDFGSPDDQPVDIFIALIAPEENHEQHLNTLAQLAQYFQDEQFKQALRKCQSTNELRQFFFTQQPKQQNHVRHA